jgi:hypothetical protein
MLTYVCIGLLFAWIMEILISNQWNPDQPKYQRIYFNHIERLIMILLWPIWIVLLIHKQLNKRK